MTKTSAKTKQKAKTNVANRTKSHALIRNMIRIGISTISKVRELWQDELFAKVNYGGTEIHQLESAEIDNNGDIIVKNIEAFRLTQWLERGVFDAIEKEYLKSVMFAIQTKHPITNEMITVETYEFAISYESTDGSTATINGLPLLSNDGLKAQAKRFLKTVYDFSSTLDDLPEERSLSMMLKYYSHCPPDYEPEFFHSNEGKSLDLHSTTTTIKLGSVITPELNMHMTFNGLESLNFTDLARVGVNTDMLNDTENKLRNMSVKNTSMLCASAKINNYGEEIKVGQTEDEIDINKKNDEMHQENEEVDKENEEVDKENEEVHKENEEVHKKNDRSRSSDSQMEDESSKKSIPLSEQLLQYLNDNEKSKTADIVKNFNSIKSNQIKKHLSKLKSEGIIDNPERGIWLVVKIAKTNSNMDTNLNSVGQTPVVQAQDPISQDPPPAPRKRDRIAKTDTMLEEKEIAEESRSIQSPECSMKSQTSSDEIESRGSQSKRRKFSIVTDSLHLLKGVNDGVKKSPVQNSTQNLLFRD